MKIIYYLLICLMLFCCKQHSDKKDVIHVKDSVINNTKEKKKDNTLKKVKSISIEILNFDIAEISNKKLIGMC